MNPGSSNKSQPILSNKDIRKIIDHSEKKVVDYKFNKEFLQKMDYFYNNRLGRMSIPYFLTNLLQHHYFIRLSDIFKYQHGLDMDRLNTEQQLVFKKEILIKSRDQVIDSIINLRDKDEIIDILPFFDVVTTNTGEERLVFDIVICYSTYIFNNQKIKSLFKSLYPRLNITLGDAVILYLKQVYQTENLFFIPLDLILFESFEDKFPYTTSTLMEMIKVFGLQTRIKLDTTIATAIKRNPFLLSKKVTTFEETKVHLNTDALNRINLLSKDKKVVLSYQNLELLYLSPSYLLGDFTVYDLIVEKMEEIIRFIFLQPPHINEALTQYALEYFKVPIEEIQLELDLFKTNPEEGKYLLKDAIDKQKMSLLFIDQKGNGSNELLLLAINLQQYLNSCDVTKFEKIINLDDDTKIYLFQLLIQAFEIPEEKLPGFAKEEQIQNIIKKIAQKEETDKGKSVTSKYINDIQRQLNIYVSRYTYSFTHDGQKYILPYKKLKSFLVNQILNEDIAEFNDIFRFKHNWKVKAIKVIIDELKKSDQLNNDLLLNYGFQYLSEKQDRFFDKENVYQASLEFEELSELFSYKYELSEKYTAVLDKQNYFDEHFGSQALRNIYQKSFSKKSIVSSILLFIPNFFIRFLPEILHFSFNNQFLLEKKGFKQELENEKNYFHNHYRQFKHRSSSKIHEQYMPDLKYHLEKNYHQVNKELQLEKIIDQDKQVNPGGKSRTKALKARAYNLDLPERSSEKTFLQNCKKALVSMPDAYYITVNIKDSPRITMDLKDKNQAVLVTSGFAFSLLNINKSIDEVLTNLYTHGIIELTGELSFHFTPEGKTCLDSL
ncbi:MAG: hypothetical protein MJB14_21020 [Spirochaetes bacterium]|nr:hypothetical protein [Spirochaetota bacterium]